MKLLRSHPVLLFSLLAITVVLTSDAQTSVSFQPGQGIAARPWEVVDVKFTGPKDAQAPFEVEAAAEFTGPDNARLKVPLFYNGGSEFVLRFTPPSAGEWKFRTSSPAPALDGLSGTIATVAAKAGRRGPVGIAPASKQRFAYADGSAYVPIAFECDWLFALDAANRADIPKTRTLAQQICEAKHTHTPPGRCVDGHGIGRASG